MITLQERQILLERVSEVSYEMFMAVIKFFTLVNYEEYYDDFNLVIMDEENLRYGLGSEISHVFNNHINTVCSLMGITFSSELLLEKKILMMNTILNLQNLDFSIRHELLKHLESDDEDNVEILTTILSGEINLCDQEIYEGFDEIDDALIQDISEILSKNDSSYIDPSDLRNSVLKNRVLKLLKSNDVTIPIDIGYFIIETTTTFTLSKYLEWYGSKLSSNDPNKVFSVVIIMLLLSKDSRENPLVSYYDTIESRIDTTIVSEVNSEIDRFINENLEALNRLKA